MVFKRRITCFCLVFLAGCQSHSPSTPSVEFAIQESRLPAADRPARLAVSESDHETATQATPDDTVFATVNGRPIMRGRVIGLLLKGHGPSMLDQLVSCELADASAAEAGIVITPKEVQVEYDRALTQLVDTMPSDDGDRILTVQERVRAEAILSAQLNERNISHEEYDLVIRRNATLRALAEKDLHLTDEEIAAEWERLHGPRASLRHIQLPTLLEAQRVLAQLREGAEFEDMARRYSANLHSANRGGRLNPFTRNDESVPFAIRESAFLLDPGATSDPVRVDSWYHILQLEEIIPGDSTMTGVDREAARRRLRERKVAEGMERLMQTLLEDADVEIKDPDMHGIYEAARSEGSRP